MLIEATDELLTEEGFDAISARRIAERAGLKPQLVHYYFRTMDDLIVEVFRRATDKHFEQCRQALESPQPVHSLWHFNLSYTETRRGTEFVALGSHREALRAEIARSRERFRTLQIAAIAKTLAAREVDPDRYPAEAVAVIMSSASRLLAMEGVLGVSLAHDALRDLMQHLLDFLEPATEPAG